MSDVSKVANREYPRTDAQKESGDWNPVWETFSDLDPAFLEAYLSLRSVPFEGGVLPPRYKELIMVAVNASTTHLFAPGVRRHVANALRAGATKEEVVETVQLASLIGIHASNLAMPIIREEIDRYTVEDARRSNKAGEKVG